VAPPALDEMMAGVDLDVAGPRRWRWLPRWSAGAVTVALSTGCTIAVALVALLALGGHHAAVKSPGAALSSVASLKTKLAVLRRPQTAAERAYRTIGPARPGKGPAELIVSLTRLATTIQTPTVGRVDV
jgi:hypothetical protein